eukprot:s579_g8.t1
MAMENQTERPRLPLRLPKGYAVPTMTRRNWAWASELTQEAQLAWLIEHAGSMYTLYAHDGKLKDGLTSFRRLKGRDWAASLPPWGEAVDYKHKLEARWATGIFVGVRLNSAEKVIATPEGIVVVQSIKRKPKELWWDAELFGKVEAAETQAGEKGEILRRVCLRQTDFDAHGYTATCRACDLIREGMSGEGVSRQESTSRSLVRSSITIWKFHKVSRLLALGAQISLGCHRSFTGRTYILGARKREREATDEDMVVSLFLDSRIGCLNSLAAKGEKYPTCEEEHETRVYEKAMSYWDDVSGKPLRADLVEAALAEEIKVINQMGVWEVIPRPRDEKVLKTRWVDVNKRDEDTPKYRSRLVAKELRKRFGSVNLDAPSWEDFYASMPPINALRTLFAMATTQRIPDLDGKMQRMHLDTCLLFLDVKKPHFWAEARRRLLVELPPEAGVDTSKLIELLHKSLYGTRDAPANWEHTIKKGRSTFTALAGKRELEWFTNAFSKEWTVEVRGYLGPPGMEGTQQAIDILNRLVSWTSRGIEVEADPRHAALIQREVNCTESAKVSTPLVKERIEETEAAELLDDEMASRYRSVSMRLAYLAQDRPDLMVLAKELAKGSHSAVLRKTEYYGLLTAACNALGEQATLKDWGVHLPVQCWMDANTGLAIASRHGLGKVKHIDTVFLWVQQVVGTGRIALGEKPTADMLADMMTEPLERARTRMLLERMNYHYMSGRHHLGLNV